MTPTMKALVIHGPGDARVDEVAVPHPGPGQVVVAVERAGICGTDLELLDGTMPYLHDGSAVYPLRPGHEWSGRVLELGAGISPDWSGVHVTGDTMIGCGDCRRCRDGRHNVCDRRYEIGVRGGWHGALAERVLVPVVALRRLPDAMSPVMAAMVEPGGNAYRTVAAAGLRPGHRVCVWGAGTIGLLVLAFSLAEGAVVDVVAPRAASREMAERLGANRTFHPDGVPDHPYDAVIDATNNASVPARAVEQVEPGGRVVLVGLAGSAATLDSRGLVLRDITVTGILAASQGLDPTIAAYSTGAVRPEPLVDRVITLQELAALWSDASGDLSGRAPKIHVDPRRATATSPSSESAVPAVTS